MSDNELAALEAERKSLQGRLSKQEAALAKARSALSKGSIHHLRPHSSFCCYRCLGRGAILCCGGMMCVMLGLWRECAVEGAVIVRYPNRSGGPLGKVVVACSAVPDDGADIAILQYALSSIRGMSKDHRSKEWTWTPQD